MKRAALYLSIAILLLTACGTNNDNMLAYGIIEGGIAVAHPAQQKFVDKITEAIIAVKNDNDAVADTALLLRLLDTAKTANKDALGVLVIAKEIDGELKYKAQAIKYEELVGGLLNKEFPETIQILVSNSENKLESLSKMIKPGLTKMKAEGTALSEVAEKVRIKYNISETTSKVVGGNGLPEQ